ncbi:MAG: MFS transporter [Verrucomicrobiae bacterium]|nr:MFS transporter [Verrucomicrobiae bacterium]
MNRKPSLLVIFLTVFIDLIGFGIIVPLVPMYSRHYGASGFMIGVVIASFSAMQFIFSPIWGKLSDRYGRRPILLISTAGASVSYVIFALASGLENHAAALWLMLVSRMFAGACGGNITVAQAYVADISKPEERSKRMGLIGMAFGLGFIFGPIISGVALVGFGLGGFWGIPKIVFHGFGPTGPGWAAAGLCAFNFLLAYRILVESLKPDSTHAGNRPRFAQWGHTLSQPKIGLLILIFFLATFAFSCFESTLPLLVSDNFNLGTTVDETKPASTVISLFVFCGVLAALIQGGLIGRLVKLFGEPNLISMSLIITGASLVLLPLVKGDGPLSWSKVLHLADQPWLLMLGALVLLSVGSSLSRAPLFGMLSNLTPANEQGATIGVAQSAGSLARIVGPLFAATLYGHVPMLPYLICGGISIVTGFMVFPLLRGKSEPATAG